MEVKLTRGETVSSVAFFYATEYQFWGSPSEDFKKIGASGELFYDKEEGGYLVVLRMNNESTTLNSLWITIDSAIKILVAHEERALKLLNFLRENGFAKTENS